MKKEDFKKILKPLIRQTVREVILEEGMLSGIITEVVRGLNTGVVMETKKEIEQEKLEEQYERKRQERIKRLNESVKVKADGEVVREVNLSANIDKGDFGDVRKVLEVGFIVLAVLLVILGLIIAFTKLKGGDDEEPLGEEGGESAGQTYY